VALVCTHLAHASLDLTESMSQTASRLVQPFCRAHGTVSLYCTAGRPSPSQNCPFPWEIWTPSNTWFLGRGPPELTPQTASQSNEQFFQGSQSCQTDRHTTSSVTIGRIYVVLRCDLIMHNNHNHSPNNTDRIVDDGRQRPNS